MKKKVFSIFFAALMIVLMLPTVAFADDTLQGDTNKNGTVDVYMTKLREKFSVCDEFEIVTVHGLGYKAVLK